MEWIQNAYTLQTFCLHFSHINQELPSVGGRHGHRVGFGLEERRRRRRRKGGESVGNWPLVDFNQEIVCDAEERERGGRLLDRPKSALGLGAVFVRFAPRGKLGTKEGRRREGSRTGRPDFSSGIRWL